VTKRTKGLLSGPPSQIAYLSCKRAKVLRAIVFYEAAGTGLRATMSLRGQDCAAIICCITTMWLNPTKQHRCFVLVLHLRHLANNYKHKLLSRGPITSSETKKAQRLGGMQTDPKNASPLRSNFHHT
jgi:hypothetical protein